VIDRERGGGRCWDSNNREVLRIWLGGVCLIWDSKIEVLVGGGGGGELGWRFHDVNYWSGWIWVVLAIVKAGLGIAAVDPGLETPDVYIHMYSD